MAVGESDFIATHKLICEERGGRLIPLVGNHTTTLERSKHHNLVFPALGLVRSARAVEHERVLESIMARCEASGRSLGYDAGFTMAPEVRNDPHKAQELHDAFKALKVLFLKEYALDECITAATVRFKVERICAFWGYEPLKENGVQLGPIPVPKMDAEMVLVCHLSKLKASAIEFARQYQALWESRVVIAANGPADRKLAA